MQHDETSYARHLFGVYVLSYCFPAIFFFPLLIDLRPYCSSTMALSPYIMETFFFDSFHSSPANRSNQQIHLLQCCEPLTAPAYVGAFVAHSSTMLCLAAPLFATFTGHQQVSLGKPSWADN